MSFTRRLMKWICPDHPLLRMPLYSTDMKPAEIPKVVDSLREEVFELREGYNRIKSLDNPAMRWLHRALVKADEIVRLRNEVAPPPKGMIYLTQCRAHKAPNCAHPDCYKIRRLEWILARISCAATEAVNPKDGKALAACGRMAEDALSYDRRTELFEL